MPRVTVLIPTHNRAGVLKNALASLRDQTMADFEAFVVGDGCTDDTADLVQRVARSDSRFVWFPLPKAKGFGYANRNIALQQASGELVAFLGHDNIYFPDHLQIGCDLMDGAPEALLGYTRPLWVDRHCHIMPGVTNLSDPFTRTQYGEGNSIPASCVFYRAESHQRVGYWSEELDANGDWDLWKRILAAAPEVAYDPRPTVFHFVADWRTEVPVLHHTLLRIVAERHNCWPDELTVKVDAASTEQDQFAQILEADPDKFNRIRAACVRMMDAALMRIAEQSATSPNTASVLASGHL